MKEINCSIAIALLICLATVAAYSQDIPETDIYVLTIGKNQKGKFVTGTPEKITPWEGYDNQPYFLPDGTGILYTSVRDSTKADIYKFTFQFAQTTQITHTPLTAEYSPMMAPDKSGISCVRVMEDDSTQFLCKMTKSDEYTVIFPKLSPVGYYCWASSDAVAMFVLGSPQTLQIGNVRTGDVKKVGERIGRCLQKLPGKANGFYYLQWDEDSTTASIYSYEMKSGNSTQVIRALNESQDFAVMPDGTFLMGSGSILYKYLPGTDEDWVKITDFEETPVEQFYRIAVNATGDKIALVTYLDERP